MGWLKNKCFSNLENESQRNNLLLFIITLSFLLGVANNTLNNAELNEANIIFYSSGILLIVIGVVLTYIPKMIRVYKYIMMILLLGLTFELVYIFNTSIAIFHMVYFTLAVSLIYLNGRLVWLIGSLSLLFTIIGFKFMKDLFFPVIEAGEMSTYIIFLLITTLAMWGVTKIGQTLINSVEKQSTESQNKAIEIEKTHRLIEKTVIQLQDRFKTLKDNVTVSSQSSEEIRVAFQEVATGAQSQAETMSQSVSQLNDIEESIKEIINQVTQVSENIDQSFEVSKGSLDTLQRFDMHMNSLGEVIKEAGTVIKELNGQTKQINEIVEVITGISNQTSLLALNANIEAARAGEHGKGFTVVANEVRKLAEESQKSAEHIKEILKQFSSQAALVEGQVVKGQKVQEECNTMLHDVQSNVTSLGTFITSLDRLMDNMVGYQKEFQKKTNAIVQDVTYAASVTEETSAATEQVLASVEEETSRNHDSVRALNDVNQQVNQLEKIFSKKKS
jgi:methyl-accepting chemotaxis protein